MRTRTEVYTGPPWEGIAAMEEAGWAVRQIGHYRVDTNTDVYGPPRIRLRWFVVYERESPPGQE